MKKLIPALLVAILFISCNKNEDKDYGACDFDDPMEVSWIVELKESMKNCTCELSIIQASYKNQTVFYTAMTDPLCDGMFGAVLMDCEGNEVKTYGIDERDVFYEEVTDQVVIYRSNN